MNKNDFENSETKEGFTMKLWRGERMCLLGFDVEKPEPDLVGFAIECKGPDDAEFSPLPNRIAFSYDKPTAEAVTGKRQFSSLENPFQKFRWIHFPNNPTDGTYRYRVTKMHMPKDEAPIQGTALTLDISLDPVTYHDFVDVGFTRNFASSQAFLEKFPPGANMNEVGSKIIPPSADKGLTFKKLQAPPDLYQWMGFEAHDLLFNLLDEAVGDQTTELNVFSYDFNEGDILEKLKKLGKRLRIIIDDSAGHGSSGSAESQAANILKKSAGTKNVARTHFKRLQHNKVFILKKNGKATKVLCGSCNHSYRGLYIQANNVLVFDQPDIAGLFSQYFDATFSNPSKFSSSELASKWHLVQVDGKPPVRVCFSPHKSADLSLNPVRAAIDQAQTSVLYNIAFLNQIPNGPTREALDRLMQRTIFSYGVADKAGGLELTKPDGSRGLVDFAFLAKTAPQPFNKEWSGQKGINIHHKFVVTDFNLPSAKVFTGSCNMAVGGEQSNGDHLVMIEDRKIATGYAIEAVRVFDHLHFRDLMKKGQNKPKVLKLRKPTKLSGEPPWFGGFYVQGSQREQDRKLFSH
jgi:phosphatidylserine/phosphatidylglycerophosphate/cardiolipin synthase-like enzyme